MDPDLANSVLANVDTRIYHILQTFIPSNSFEAWSQAQEQVEGQLAIASTVVESTTNVPDLVIATKMFWRSKSEGWPDWKQIVGCSVEVLQTHPWYRPADPPPSPNATLGDLHAPSEITNVCKAQEVPTRETKDKGKQREVYASPPTQDAPDPRQETHHFKQTSVAPSRPAPSSPAPSRPGSPPLLPAFADEDTTLDEILSNEEDELEQEPERGRSTTRRTSTANQRGTARSQSRGRRGMFPTCSPGLQITGACSSCRMSNYICSLADNGGSCIQCKTRRKKCDYAGPRGPPRGKSRTRKRSPSPPTHPPSKRPRAQSRVRRSASPANTGSSDQKMRSPTPVPTKRRRTSSRAAAKHKAKSTAQESRRLPTIIIPPLHNRATATCVSESGEGTMPAAGDAEELPARPLPSRDLPSGSARRALKPAELGVTLGRAYSVQGEPLVTKGEHQEIQRQLATMKAENDWVKSELKNAYSLIHDMEAKILTLQVAIEGTHPFSMGSGEQHPEPPGTTEACQSAAPNPSPSNVTKLPSKERESIPPIEALNIWTEDLAGNLFPSAIPEETSPVEKSASNTAEHSERGHAEDLPEWTPFVFDREDVDRLAGNAVRRKGLGNVGRARVRVWIHAADSHAKPAPASAGTRVTAAKYGKFTRLVRSTFNVVNVHKGNVVDDSAPSTTPRRCTTTCHMPRGHGDNNGDKAINDKAATNATVTATATTTAINDTATTTTQRMVPQCHGDNNDDDDAMSSMARRYQRRNNDNDKRAQLHARRTWQPVTTTKATRRRRPNVLDGAGPSTTPRR
ncbi:hypothetical protein EV363DRAFT_1299667 [Boletus edulis]|nr:hypothetical protein EV363DRAFT_1299667 [Boletus edulis]